MNEIIVKLLNWCYEHDYAVRIDSDLIGKPFPYVTVTLSRDRCSVQHIFNLDNFSEDENKLPSTKWFSKWLNYELQSFLDYAENRFSEHEVEVKNNGKD